MLWGSYPQSSAEGRSLGQQGGAGDYNNGWSRQLQCVGGVYAAKVFVHALNELEVRERGHSKGAEKGSNAP